MRFLAEARRVARELVVVDSRRGERRRARSAGGARSLKDGSRWEVFKRVVHREALAAELGGGEVLHAGRWFVVVVARDAP